MAPDHSIARCVACGYDLTGLAHGATCPECGTPGAVFPKPRPKLLGTVTGRSLVIAAGAATAGLGVNFLPFFSDAEQYSIARDAGAALIDWSGVLLLVTYAAAGFWAVVVPSSRRPSLVWLVWLGLALLIVGILMPAIGS